MTTDDELLALAEEIGVRIEYAVLPPDRDGEYRRKYRVIRLRRGMSARLHRSVLCHELCHAVFDDEPSKFGPVNMKQEGRADEWAAMRLITHEDYVRAETIHDGHAGAMAVELGVVRSIVEAYRRVLQRIDNTVYVKPMMGTGQYTMRVEVA